jgi:hypothetical protein
MKRKADSSAVTKLDKGGEKKRMVLSGAGNGSKE